LEAEEFDIKLFKFNYIRSVEKLDVAGMFPSSGKLATWPKIGLKKAEQSFSAAV
jgi:hypothetical protein